MVRKKENCPCSMYLGTGSHNDILQFWKEVIAINHVLNAFIMKFKETCYVVLRSENE